MKRREKGEAGDRTRTSYSRYQHGKYSSKYPTSAVFGGWGSGTKAGFLFKYLKIGDI